CHGNPISPDDAFRKESDEALRKTIELAAMMGVPVVNAFSGTPAGNETDTSVNWPVTPWPEEYSEIKEWQWENRLVPYWKEIGELAEAHDVKIGLELHGGFLVHSPHTMLELRRRTNTYIERISIRVTCGGRESIRWPPSKYSAVRAQSTISMPRILTSIGKI